MNVSETAALRLLFRCRSVSDVLSDYIEGEVSPVDRVMLWGHLMMCRRCRAYLKQFQNIAEVAGSLAGEELPAGAEEALRGALAAWREGEPRDGEKH